VLHAYTVATARGRLGSCLLLFQPVYFYSTHRSMQQHHNPVHCHVSATHCHSRFLWCLDCSCEHALLCMLLVAGSSPWGCSWLQRHRSCSSTSGLSGVCRRSL